MATTRVGLYRDARKKHPWIVRWFGEPDEHAEEPQRYSKAFVRKRDAVEFQAAKQAEFDKGGQRNRPAAITLGDFCEKYLARREHEWAEPTRMQIAEFCQRLTDHFGKNTRLRAITPERASAFWSQARDIRKYSTGGELSRSTRNRLLRYGKTAFKYAIAWGFLATNPFDGMKQMRVGKRNRRDWRFVKPGEYRALLRVAPSLRWKMFYALAYTSAARSGELFNLTDDCVDLKRGRLLVRSRKPTDALPPFHVKDHEDREIPLPRHVLRLVAGWLRVRPKGSPFILLAPERYERVLERWRTCRKAGKPWLNDYMTNNTVRDIRSHAKMAGLKLDGALTVHCFRKSCGQNWADHLPMNVVKELMGHANISTTAEFYSTVSEEHETKAQWVIEALTMGVSPKATDARLTPTPPIDPIQRVG